MAEEEREQRAAGDGEDVVPEDAMVTMDYRDDRVRLWVDASGGVVRAPVCG